MQFIRRLIYTLWPFTSEPLQLKLNELIASGPATFHAVLFIIVFCETGLVVTPFLPGDSLLFTVGAIGASPQAAFSLPVIGLMLVCAALLGDNTNYWIGHRLGPAVFSREDSRVLNKKHLMRAQAFYDKYGAKTIVLARFVPIVRTFAPFVAGVGRMHYGKFLLFSIVGAAAWVTVCMAAGVLFGSRPFVQKHFELVIVAIIIISVLPMAIEILRGSLRARRERAAAEVHADAERGE